MEEMWSRKTWNSSSLQKKTIFGRLLLGYSIERFFCNLFFEKLGIPENSLAFFFFFTKTFVFNEFIRCGFRGEVPIRQMCKIRCFRLIPQTINRNALFLQLNCIIFFSFFSPQIYHSFWEKMAEKFMNFLLLLHYWWKVLKIQLIKSNYASLFFTVIPILSIFFFMISVYSYAQQESF